MEERLAELEERISKLERMAGSKTLDRDGIYTPAEAAAWLRCSKTNVYDLILSGELAVTRVGAGSAGIRIWGNALQSFLQSRTTGGPKNEKKFTHLKAFLG